MATAQVHADLADAFGTDTLAQDAIRDMAEQMYRRLDLAVAAVPELARYADMIGTGCRRPCRVRRRGRRRSRLRTTKPARSPRR
jgi:maltokinase